MRGERGVTTKKTKLPKADPGLQADINRCQIHRSALNAFAKDQKNAANNAAARLAKKMDAWKAKVQKVADELLPGLGNLWASDDPYELSLVGKSAFEAGESPSAFFESVFGEDLARNAYDEDLAAEALQHEEEREEECVFDGA
jgi:hypothetical protein